MGTTQSPLAPAPRSSLEGERAHLRLTEERDLEPLHEILNHPEVARWWGRFDRERVRDELITPDPDDESVIYTIEIAGNVAGVIQYSEELDPDYRCAGIDIFLDPAYHGRGFGGEAIRTLARHLFEDRGHHRLTIDPAASNHRAIRSYERVGFRAVGVMRQYERDSDGVWRDGLLLDLLREELIAAP